MQGLVRSASPLLLGCGLLTLATALEAYPVRLEYTYRVTAVNGDAGTLNDTVAVGDEFTGYYTVDSNALRDPTGPGNQGGYHSDARDFPHETILGPFVHRSDGHIQLFTPTTTVVVCNDCADSTSPTLDSYQVGHNAYTTRMVGPQGDEYALLINKVELALRDYSGVALTEVTQPLQLDLADWPDARALNVLGGKDVNGNGVLDRHTHPPEPLFFVNGVLLSIESVFDPAPMAVELLDAVIALDLAEGLGTALDAKLQQVLRALDAVNEGNTTAAANALQAFILLVEAQTGKKIPEDAAAQLTALAQEIIEVLNGAP